MADLAPALRNAKAHDLQALAASVEAFGLLEPVVLDERTSRLVSGHGRAEWLAASELAGKPDTWPADRAWPPEGVWVDGEGRWCWLVTRGFTSRDDNHAHAAGIALNRVGERGGWVPELLAQDLDSLIGTQLFDATGFNADDLDDLVALASGGGIELANQGTDAEYAKHEGRGEPQVPRSVQGLHEVGLMFQADQHREYLEHLAKLRRAWGTDAAPLVVLRGQQAGPPGGCHQQRAGWRPRRAGGR